jgi:chitodextrinase
MKRKLKHHPKHYHFLAVVGAAMFVFAFGRFMLPTPQVAHALDVTVDATVNVYVPPGGGGPPPPPPTPIPLIISNIRVPVLGTTFAEVAWDTNNAATSYLDYGLTTAYELGTVGNTNIVFSRQLPLGGLTPATLYHFRVRGMDANSSSAQSGDNTFTTLGVPDTVPPTLFNIVITNITTNSATVSWTTDELSDSLANVGLTAAYGMVFSSSVMTVTHSLDMIGLTPATLYHVQGVSADPSGNVGMSSDVTFTTLPGVDLIPPANVANLVVTNVPNRPALQLNWTNPTDSDFAGVVIRARTDMYPTSQTDGRFVYDGIGTSLLDDNLVPGTTYYYGLFAYDTSGNYASGAFGQGTIPPLQTFWLKVRPEKRVPKTGKWDVDGAVDFRSPGTLTAVESIPVSVPNVGEVEVLTTQAPGIFDGAFKGLGYLRSTVKNFNLTYGSMEDFSIGGTKLLLGGDVHVSNDNLVNSLDISTEVNKLNTGYIVTDLNRDGLVNSLDLGILLSNLMKWGEK